MGPAATADMLEKFVELRHASCDQQHIPLIVSSIPDIPDRTACLLSGGPSPYRYLERYLHMLEDAGAEVSLSHATLRIIGLMIYRTSRKRE